MFPIGPRSRRVLNQSTQSRVANSTACTLGQGAAGVDDLGLVEAVDGLGEGVVVAVADAADRRLHAGVGQALRVLQGQILHPPVAVVDQTATRKRPARMQGLVQSIKDQRCLGPSRDPPADDVPREGVDDKGHIDETGSRGHIGEICHPQGIGSRRLELAIDMVVGRQLEWPAGDNYDGRSTVMGF